MLGFVVDGDANKDQYKYQYKDQQYGTELQQQVAATEW